jgi:hypothetical protein
MKVSIKQKERGLEIRLNGRYVGMEANCTDKIVSIQTGGYKDHKLLGITSTGKAFEISGGRHAGGARNDYWLLVDDVVIDYAHSGKELLELLCAIEWTDKQVAFSNKLYKERYGQA